MCGILTSRMNSTAVEKCLKVRALRLWESYTNKSSRRKVRSANQLTPTSYLAKWRLLFSKAQPLSPLTQKRKTVSYQPDVSEKLTEEHWSLDTVGFEGATPGCDTQPQLYTVTSWGNMPHHRVPEALDVCYLRVSRSMALGSVFICFSTDSDTPQGWGIALDTI